MNKKLLLTGAIFGIFAIGLGAFAAHGLESLIDSDSLKSFETGVKYQMYHALFLLIIGSTSMINKKHKKIILYAVLIGIILFSGSIYGLATNALTSFDFKTIALLTPLGGLTLILGWIVTLVGILKSKVD